MTSINIPVTVSENDLKRIGQCIMKNFWYDEDEPRNGFEDGTSFFFGGDTFQIEFMFLRSIIRHLGYRLTEGEDWNENGEVRVMTTYPWEKYRNLKDGTDDDDDQEDVKDD